MSISLFVNGIFAVGWGAWCLIGHPGAPAWFAFGFHLALTFASAAFYAVIRATR